MSKNTNAYQYDMFDMFDNTVTVKDKPVKKQEKAIIFPIIEFPKEKQIRERMRQQRENTNRTRNETQASVIHTPTEIPTIQRVTPRPEQPRPEQPRPVQPEPAPEQPRPVQPEQPAPEKISRFITAIICASGIAAAFMSIYHSYHYLLIAGKPAWVAMITAIVMVLFSATIFSFPAKGSAVYAYALRILGFATVFFSIFCTISVNYEQFLIRENAETQTEQINKSKQAEIEILNSQIAGIEVQIDTLQKETEYWKTISWAKRDTAYDALQEAYNERTDLWEKLSIVTGEAYQIPETKTIFTYLAGIFNISKNVLEFILFCIPAVFYDLLSPLAINAVLKKRR